MGLVSQAVHDGGRHVIGWEKDAFYVNYNANVPFLYVKIEFLSCYCLSAESFPRHSCLERYVCYDQEKVLVLFNLL